MDSRHLYIFNPDCELAIANGSCFYTPSANVVKMGEDLAFLPAWLGKPDDMVLVKELPDASFRDFLSEELLLRCLPVRESELDRYSGLVGVPWGKSPKICHWLEKKDWERDGDRSRKNGIVERRPGRFEVVDTKSTFSFGGYFAACLLFSVRIGTKNRRRVLAGKSPLVFVRERAADFERKAWL